MLPVRWVLVRDPDAKRDPQAFFSTDVSLEPTDIIALYVRRWQIEVTFAETRAHLGVETQRQWTDNAIARTTPALLGLYSLVSLWACDLLTSDSIPYAAAWYRKTSLTFSDAIGQNQTSQLIDHAEAMLLMLADMHGATISARRHHDRPWLPPLFHDFFDEQSYHAQIGQPETIARLLKQPRTAAYPREIFDPQGIHDATVRFARWCRADSTSCGFRGDPGHYSEMIPAGIPR
ncbi:hypothetical protein GCM10011494_38520 [Novosphingobium endophyticum]|uniref:Transposase IS4-like domain-containing protein n=1 Tax=Novosphingobium endophyticum TaxID=1955250 RepID=A0A916X6A4_9SPHN|nr:hypothetical protein [Novosphingobium endophyticum]GGC15916.1 hypothetical protein GCM10011494_38520 [Novosphingobium endophyticum]